VRISGELYNWVEMMRSDCMRQDSIERVLRILLYSDVGKICSDVKFSLTYINIPDEIRIMHLFSQF
jgi:hypothetical protein